MTRKELLVKMVKEAAAEVVPMPIPGSRFQDSLSVTPKTMAGADGASTEPAAQEAPGPVKPTKAEVGMALGGTRATVSDVRDSLGVKATGAGGGDYRVTADMFG